MSMLSSMLKRVDTNLRSVVQIPFLYFGVKSDISIEFCILESRVISASKGEIFRKEAIEKYSQGRDKNVLPQFVLPPVFVFFWCLLALFISAGVTAWLGHVPVYTSGAGFILDPSSSGGTVNGEMTAIIFVPYNSSLPLRVGQPVTMQVGQTGPQVNTAIGAVESEILSPSDVRKQFSLSATGPSQAATVVVTAHFSSLYSGSLVQAQVEVGSRRLLSLFPGLGAFAN
jgi:hypothetical protein